MANPGILQKLLDHIALFTGHGATSAATAGRIAMRDGAGRMQAADPAADLDVVNKRSMAGTSVPLSRVLHTSYPLGGGGALNADRTLTVARATTDAPGVVQLATAAEAAAGSDGAKVITPSTLKAAVGNMGNSAPLPKTASGVGQFKAASNSDTKVVGTTSDRTWYLVLPAGGTWLYSVRYTRTYSTATGSDTSGETESVVEGMNGIKGGGSEVKIPGTDKSSGHGQISKLSGFFWRIG